MDGSAREGQQVSGGCPLTRKPAAASDETQPHFFESAAAFRRWLKAHHATSSSVIVGYYKKHAGQPTLTWTESVREALCFGWIDGVVRKLDDDRYTHRFTPRKPKSIWSAVNIRHAEELIAAGLMQPAGLAAFQARSAERSAIYSFEQREVALAEPYAAMMAAHADASAFWDTLPASYRKAVSWWVSSAKQEATRERRFSQLIAACTERRRLPQFSLNSTSKR